MAFQAVTVEQLPAMTSWKLIFRHVPHLVLDGAPGIPDRGAQR